MFPNSEPLERKDTLLLKEACAGDSYQKLSLGQAMIQKEEM